MKLRDLMITDPVILHPEQTIKEAAEIFNKYPIDGAPVLDSDNKLVGVFTKSHLFETVAKGMNPDEPIASLMVKKVVTAHPDDMVDTNFYFDHSILPIVENENLCGIITRSTYLKTLYESHHNLSRELDAIINSTKDMIMSIDENGNISILNESAQKKLGARLEKVKGKNLRQIKPCIKIDKILDGTESSLVRKVEIDGQAYLSRSYPIIRENKTIGVVSTFQDTTDLEKIASEIQSVKELNKDLDAIIESTSDGIFVCDGQANVLRINRAYGTISSLDIEKIKGRNMKDLVKEGLYNESVTLKVLEEKKTITIIQETSTDKTLLVTGTPVFSKDGSIARVVSSVRDITELNRMRQQLEQSQMMTIHYRTELETLKMKTKDGQEGMVASSKVMRDFIDIVVRLAHVDSTILITGESGTGKELVADLIHSNSSRQDMPLIKVNCGAIPENLLESELFGYESGAFTGAQKGGKAGYFEMAEGGIIFLDEIGELPINLQAKLLRVLQFKEINRIGGQKPRKVQVRIIAATNRNLLEMINEKTFREDLYYRLNVVPVHIPPLRDRKDDIPHLTAHFVQIFNDSYNLNKKINSDVINIFMEYDWPGNVRQLRNIIERMMVMTSEDILQRTDIPPHICSTLNCKKGAIHVPAIIPLKEALESVEKQLLEMAYNRHRTTRQMAKDLGIDASTIVRKAAKYGICRKDE